MKEKGQLPSEERVVGGDEGYVELLKSSVSLSCKAEIPTTAPHFLEFNFMEDDDLISYSANLVPWFKDGNGYPTLYTLDISTNDTFVCKIAIGAVWEDGVPEVEVEVHPFDKEEVELLDFPNLGYVLKNSLEKHYKKTYFNKSPNGVFETPFADIIH